MEKTIVIIDLVRYSEVVDTLEDALDVKAVSRLNEQIQLFVDAGLRAIKANHQNVVHQPTGDGAILKLDRPADAHQFAKAVNEATDEHNRNRAHPIGKRVFRIGAATGPLDTTPDDIAGKVIARASRLESKATPGGVLVDEATHSQLRPTQQKQYGAKEDVAGKRQERYAAYRCVFSTARVTEKNLGNGPRKSPKSTWDHFYTVDADERRRAIDELGYDSEGISCYVFTNKREGTQPLYRLHNPDSHDHFYCTTEEERDRAMNEHGYKFGRVECWIYLDPEPDATQLFRLFQPKQKNHFYTHDSQERDRAVEKYGYRDEDFQYFVAATQVSGSVPLFRLSKSWVEEL